MLRPTSTAIALMLTAAPGLAQLAGGFESLDTDGTGGLTSEEFQPAGIGVFRAWDADQDAVLEEAEFYRALHAMWDTDDDGRLDEAEYRQGWREWSGAPPPVDYEALDADAAYGIDVAEFGRGLGEAGVHEDWAGGSMPDPATFSAALFERLDADDDGTLTGEEFDALGSLVMAGFEGPAPVEGEDVEVISLDAWGYEEIYADGMSAEDFIDEFAVYGETGEEIGEVEDLIVGPDGDILSVVAEVGGFWDIGDTHVSVPWSAVRLHEAGDGIVVPVTEETVQDYDLVGAWSMAADAFGQEIAAGVDDEAPGPRAWRVSELIGDYARLGAGTGVRNYGYVNDVILSDGAISAVVVQPAFVYGGGYRAYPWYGYETERGWEPGDTFYDLPYGEDEAGEMEAFDYEALGADR